MKEKLVIKADRKAVILDQFWPIVGLFLIVMLLSLILFGGDGNMMLLMGGVYLAVLIVCAVLLLPRSKAEYTFLPASEYRGTRLMIQLGSQEYEVFDVPPTDFVFGQSWVEKKLGVGHMRIKHTQFYLRGIHEMEQVQEWVKANFKVREVRPAGKKGKKGKKK